MFEAKMLIGYVDESGDVQPLPLKPAANGNDQPVLVIANLMLSGSRLESLTHDFLHLKHRFFPGLPYTQYEDKSVVDRE